MAEAAAPRHSGLRPWQLGALVAVLALSALTGALHYAGTADLAVFILGAIALAGLAWIVSFATEAVGERFGPAVTGVLQSTLGNLPELFVVLFALSAGQLVVAQTSIFGSLFANALLVLGATIVMGSRQAKDGVMRFSRRLPNDTATLMLLASFTIVLLGLSDRVGDPASRHDEAISVVGAICLLVVYGVWLSSYLREGHAADEEGSAGGLRLPVAITLLAVAGVGAALVSDWFVSSIDQSVSELGISKEFTGLVIVAIAGNAVENVVALVLAHKGKSDLAVSVVKNSVAQIAAFLFPALVLLSLFFETRLTFVAPAVYIGALALTAIAMWQVTGDGEATVFEGTALVAIYAVLATLAFYE